VTTPWRRASSPRSNASCSIGVASRPRPKRAWPFFEFIEGFYKRHSSLGYLSPITFERQYAATALSNPVHTSMRRARARQVKERPASVMASCIASVPAVLDSRSTRRPWQCAGRDEKMLSAEPKDRPRYPEDLTSPRTRGKSRHPQNESDPCSPDQKFIPPQLLPLKPISLGSSCQISPFQNAPRRQPDSRDTQLGGNPQLRHNPRQ
jgi:hypothetical protein